MFAWDDEIAQTITHNTATLQQEETTTALVAKAFGKDPHRISMRDCSDDTLTPDGVLAV